MPTYEYECAKCGKMFEAFQKITDKPLSTCLDGSCKGPVRRLIGTGAGFIFKGRGFYKTDYRSENYKKREKEERPDSKGPCSTCENKKECSQKEAQ